MNTETSASILKAKYGTYERQGDEFLYPCPFCNTSKRKLSVNFEKGVYKCWRCGISGRELSALEESLRPTPEEELSQILRRKLEVPNNHDPEDLKLPESFKLLFLNTDTDAYRYVIRRGFTQEMIRLHRLGYCDSGRMFNRIIIPSFDEEGKLNYYVARSYDGHVIRYLTPKGFNSSNIVFNELSIDWSKEVVLVEGFFDSAFISNSIPILGSYFRRDSLLLKKLVRRSRRVLIALDADKRDKQFKFAEYLHSRGLEVSVYFANDDRDFGDLREDAEAFLQHNRQEYEPHKPRFLYDSTYL